VTAIVTAYFTASQAKPKKIAPLSKIGPIFSGFGIDSLKFV
jgi:hypothetical protein